MHPNQLFWLTSLNICLKNWCRLTILFLQYHDIKRFFASHPIFLKATNEKECLSVEKVDLGLPCWRIMISISKDCYRRTFFCWEIFFLLIFIHTDADLQQFLILFSFFINEYRTYPDDTTIYAGKRKRIVINKQTSSYFFKLITQIIQMLRFL